MNDWIESLLHQLPPARSTVAGEVDWLFYFIFWVCVVFFVGIVGTGLYWTIKYRARKGEKPRIGLPEGNHTVLELILTFAPIPLLVYLFHAGFTTYVHEAVPPPNAMEIRVKAYQWRWDFVYPSGSVETGSLIVPQGRPVRLVMSSNDVLHAFFIPSARVKKDVVPGMYSSLWFQATETGDMQVFCAEYCGTGHNAGIDAHGTRSGMQAVIHVVPQRDYQRALDDLDRPPPGQTPAPWGEALFAQNTCTTCHATSAGAQSNCPNMVGVMHHPVDLEGGGHVADADFDYFKESVLHPQAKIVRGYTNVQMPPFVLSDARLQAIYAYLETLH